MVGFQLLTCVEQDTLDRMKTFFKTIHKVERFSQ